MKNTKATATKHSGAVFEVEGEVGESSLSLSLRGDLGREGFERVVRSLRAKYVSHIGYPKTDKILSTNQVLHTSPS